MEKAARKGAQGREGGEGSNLLLGEGARNGGGGVLRSESALLIGVALRPSRCVGFFRKRAVSKHQGPAVAWGTSAHIHAQTQSIKEQVAHPLGSVAARPPACHLHWLRGIVLLPALHRQRKRARDEC